MFHCYVRLPEGTKQSQGEFFMDVAIKSKSTPQKSDRLLR